MGARQPNDAMTNREIAERFLQLFCEGNLTGLESLLDENLSFRGPLLSAASRQEYMQALRASPPVPTPYRIVSLTEDAEDQVAVLWEYHRDGQSVHIEQLFSFRDRRIVDIVLMFAPLMKGPRQ